MLAGATAVLLLPGCASLGQREPVRINVVGLEPLPGQGMEVRLAVQLRIQNPNDAPIDFDGIALELNVNDAPFATGVSDRKGSVPRYGETVLEIPVSVSAVAMLRQAIGLMEDKPREALPYELRGRLGGPLGGMRFSDTGTLTLPDLLKAPAGTR
ncbi:LEA type 2 family protein [Pseudothauera rhizosphaerae]|uniref:Water stress and hypersensitive response domain-containing protein n=1 Tax=Pseudothauera rhizosphaerae TaxID=2565932 RepID=A0A4S4ASF9_9RHOO|nr:LEA type 2 family protein [Pseudothauera rhizosphaerae]THF62772.1 Water stress and hypersensitive response domain-containing protein [Pseudothauera rhizosphaerae]